MQIGIIAEGKADCAVIANILQAKFSTSIDEITFIRPELFKDETDLSESKTAQTEQNQQKFSTWSLVKKECVDRRNFKRFFDLFEDDRIMIVHLDTDRASDYGVKKPAKKNNANYSEQLRNLVISQITAWLENNYTPKLRYAIAIEEIESWILCIYENGTDTSNFENAKNRLQRIQNNSFSRRERASFNLTEFNKFLLWSNSFNKVRSLTQHLKKNKSLELFVDSLV